MEKRGTMKSNYFIPFDKKEIHKTNASAIFLLVILCVALYFSIRNFDFITMFLLIPILAFLVIRGINLWKFLNENRNNFNVAIREGSLLIKSYHYGEIEVQLSDIEDYYIEENTLFLYTKNVVNNRVSVAEKLFKYYLDNSENFYKITLWCNLKDIKEIENFLQHVKQNKLYKEKETQLNANLFGAYICILIGSIVCFFVFSHYSGDIIMEVLKLVFLSIYMCLIHIYNKIPLYESGHLIMRLLRCSGCSFFIAQIFLLGYRVNSFINGMAIDATVSMETIRVLVVFYIVIIAFFMHEKSLGVKCIKYNIEKKDK